MVKHLIIKSRWVSIALILIALFTALAVVIGHLNGDPIADPRLSSKYLDGFKHPTQVVKFDEGFIVAEMKTPKLMYKSTLAEASNKEFTVGDHEIKSPHFLAAYNHGVFVSEGRGEHVVFHNRHGEIELPHFSEGLRLNRPHGICVSSDGWLYIADSANSRLLRVNLKTRTSEVFKDNKRRIAYGRQLLCREDGLWLANSYEGAFKLNPGQGGNILHIKDFDSGEVKEVIAFHKANVTGLALLDEKVMIVGRWSGHYDLVVVDLETQKVTKKLTQFERQLDAPYGISLDEEQRKFYVSFLGISRERLEGEDGGVLEFSY